MEILYNALGRRLDRVDFGAIWPGFARKPFALYSGKKAFMEGEFFDKPEGFRGNTSVEHGGRRIAIWELTGQIQDADELAASLVHEMFHAFQFEQGEGRFPDDVAALDYPRSVENLAWKRRENRLLAQALRTEAPEECLRLLGQVRGIREEREKKLGGDIRWEYLPETIEGAAVYVQARALGMINPEKYPAHIGAVCERLEDDGLLPDTRRLGYSTGAALLLAAEKAGIPLPYSLREEASAYELLSAHITPEAPEGAPPEDGLREAVEGLRAGREKALKEFWAASPKETAGDFRITDYDPMNMWKQDGCLYGSRFWVLRNRETGEDVTLGEAVLKQSGAGRDIERYWVR